MAETHCGSVHESRAEGRVQSESFSDKISVFESGIVMVEQTAESIKRADKLAEYIGKVMPLIDARLAHSESPLAQRSLVAATMFVDEFTTAIRVGDKVEEIPSHTDYVVTPWFAIIYHHIENWYREHYGDALGANPSGSAHGYVLVRSLPVEMIVPLTRSRVETPGESAWLSFPKEVESDENPLDWLVKAPNIAALDRDDRESLSQDAAEIAAALRSIRVNGMGIDPSDETVHGLLDGIAGEFEAAAQKAVRNEAAGRPAALWNIHLAIERALKAFAQHKTGKFRETHNLFTLFDDVAAHGVVADRNSLKKFRREWEVIDNRYGLGDAPTVQEVFAAYKTGLTFVSSVVQSFKRKISIGGASFLLRKPPWTSLPPTKEDMPS